MKSELKVVIDTNVFISAALFHSETNRLVPLWQTEKIVYLISSEILKEYIRVLSYRKFNLTRKEIRYIIEEELLPYTHSVKVKTKINVVEEDFEDNKFVSLAIDGKAKFIVSGDKHLLKLKKIQGIKLVSVKEFLKYVLK